MNKQQWQDLYNLLKQFYSEFASGYNLSEKGSNNKKRAEGDREVDEAILMAKNHIEKHIVEIEQLITNGNPNLYTEFFQPRYFKNDMPKLLKKIEAKLNEIE